MDNLPMKIAPKQWYIVIIAVVVIVALVGGGAWLLGKKKTSPQQAPVAADTSGQIYSLSPQAIGLTIAFRSDNKAMKFTVGNASGINSIDYQISYTKEINGQQVQDGLIGTVNMNPGDSTAGIGYREFGTCSSGVCRYDKVVGTITLTLKIVKSDGKTYQVTQNATLPQ